MTESEAKQILKRLLSVDILVGNEHEAVDMAIKALGKQIAKKPLFLGMRYRHHGRHISDGLSLDNCFECPNCRSSIFHVFDSEKYCEHCGQKLDWSEV